MLTNSEWTFGSALTLRQLIRLVLAHVVTFALTLVAVLTEVSSAPAEPLGDPAAEATLILDQFGTVTDFALLDAGLVASTGA